MMLLHMRQDLIYYRPAAGVPRTVERAVSYLTYHDLEYALTRIRKWEEAHAKLENGANVYHVLLSVSEIPIMITEMDKMAALMHASVVENLPQTPEEFE